jgi:branched-chain amino acid transport system substrate-binding protein
VQARAGMARPRLAPAGGPGYLSGSVRTGNFVWFVRLVPLEGVVRCFIRLAVVILGLLAAILPADARRVALVIGNSEYKVGPLTNPGRDAAAVAEALEKQLKFDKVILRRNLSGDGFRAALREIARESAGAEFGVIYFAGHGIEVAGRNFLIPVDATLSSARDVDLEAIALDTVLGRLDGVSKLKLVILDACRNNPFALAGAKRGQARGLTRIEPEGNTLVAYAAKDGTTADDGTSGHSPFTEALLKRIATPALDVRRLFGYVSEDVMAATNRIQEPYLYGRLGGDEIFLQPPLTAAPGPAHPASPTAAPPLTAAALEWSRVDKASIAELETFELRHAASPEADYARARLRELRKPQVAVAAPPARPTLPAGPKSIRIGYAISLSGPMAPGAMLTTVTNYRLWADDMNKAGGLYLKTYNRRVPIETIEIDDASKTDDVMRLVERLIAVDKVDFVLTPWGTGANLAVAPIFARYGYPQIMGSAGSDKAEELAQKFPTMLWFLAKPADQAKALVDMMDGLRRQGRINSAVALFISQTPFGQEYASSLKPQLAGARFFALYEAVYPYPPVDLSAQIKAAKAAGADTLIALSYPPDTFMLTEQMLLNGFNPKIRFLGVGTAFPTYRTKFGDKINGVFGLGGWNPLGPGAQDYFARHKALAANNGAEPDRWASAATYAGLQALGQAIERVGEIDRGRILQELKTGTFKTIAGDLRLDGNRDGQAWQIGQWQNGEFYGVAPANRPGARQPVVH